jgi:uncharacterized protein YcfJ
MFKTLSLSAAAILASIAVTPVAAEARHYDGYRDGGYYQQVRGDRYYRGDRYRGDRRSYRGSSYCRDKGNGGTVIGAIAGGLLGHEVAGRGNDRTMGTIIGAGVGAVAGRAIDRNC